MKNSNDISYETTEPIFMKFYIEYLYVGCTKFSLKKYLLKFKVAAMPIYGKKRSNDFFSRTTVPIRLIFCMKHMGHLTI